MRNGVIKGVCSYITSNEIYFYIGDSETEILRVDVGETGLSSIPRIGETIGFGIDDDHRGVYKVASIENYINFNTKNRGGYQHTYVMLEEVK